jgi:hypothetical protein
VTLKHRYPYTALADRSTELVEAFSTALDKGSEANAGAPSSRWSNPLTKTDFEEYAQNIESNTSAAWINAKQTIGNRLTAMAKAAGQTTVDFMTDALLNQENVFTSALMTAMVESQPGLEPLASSFYFYQTWYSALRDYAESQARLAEALARRATQLQAGQSQ